MHRTVVPFATQRRRLMALSLTAACLLVPSVSLAAGSEDSPPATSAGGPAATAPANPGAPAPTATTKPGATAASAYADGKSAISRQDWKSAIVSLTQAAALEPKNADVHNLLGYSYRKSGDYKNGFKHYAIALGINPKHKGALEYQGEAYAETGELVKAKANLVKLKAACGNTSCEEYVDLAGAIKTAEAKAKSKKSTPTTKKK